MSIERALVQRLTVAAPEVTGLIAARLFPTVAPLAVPRPYAVYLRIGAQRVRSLLATSGLTMARFQFDAYAETYAESRAISEAIRRRLNAYRGTEAGVGWACRITGCSLASDADLYEPEAEPPLYRATMDFMISYQED